MDGHINDSLYIAVLLQKLPVIFLEYCIFPNLLTNYQLFWDSCLISFNEYMENFIFTPSAETV